MATDSASNTTGKKSINRKLIVVMPDEMVEATRKAERDAAASNSSIDWRSVGRFFAPGAMAIVDVSTDAYKAWAQARQHGLNITQLGYKEADKLTFPPGHPRENVLYIAHPTNYNVYYTMASFHRMAFEHKFAEAIDLLMHLGATEVKVEHVRGWSREFASKISSVASGVNLDASAGTTKQDNASLLFEANFSGSNVPALPEELTWFHHEPTWQSVSKGRISFGMTQFSLTVNYEDDFGVNAGMKVAAQGAGLELGGNFQTHEATTWKLHGKFSNK